MEPNEPNNQDDQWWNPNSRTNPQQITESYTPTQPVDSSTQQSTYEPLKRAQAQPIDDNLIRWSAREYIYQDKNAAWFIAFVMVVLLLILIDFVLIKSYSFSILVVVMAVSLVIYTRRPPREISYTLSNEHGLYIDDKLHSFEEFKSFGLLQENSQNSIYLVPLKRFSPGISVYFPSEVGEELVDIFGAKLPMIDRKLDFVDIIVKKLRI